MEWIILVVGTLLGLFVGKRCTRDTIDPLEELIVRVLAVVGGWAVTSGTIMCVMLLFTVL